MEDQAGRTQYFEWGTVEWLHEPEESDTGHPSAALVTVNVGRTQPTHVHAGFEQFLYTLSGVGTQWISGVARTIGPGLLNHNSPNVEHAVANTGDVPLRHLVIYLPTPQRPLLDDTRLLAEEEGDWEPDLEGLIDVRVLQSAQDHVAAATDMAASILDMRGRRLTQTSNISEFCRLVCSTRAGMNRCAQSEQQAGLRAARLKKPLIFDCYLGITNVVAPIMVRERSIGSVVCGQVLLMEPADSPMEDITRAGFPLESLKPAFCRLPVISKSRIYAAAELLSGISDNLVEMSLRDHSQRRLAEELKTKADMVELLKQTELQALQAQIRPHFLFNTLNTIANLALQENAPQTREMVFTMSELMRFALRSASHLVTVSEEVDHVKNYLFIQRTRFSDRLTISMEVDPSILDVPIPALTLQPLVENAIIHGLRDRKSGEVTVLGRQEGEWAVLEIRDDGIGMTPEKVAETMQVTGRNRERVGSIGLDNVRRRLQHHFGTRFSFEIDSMPGQGTAMRIKIPIRDRKDAHYG